MKTDKLVIHSSFQDFVLFLYVHVAHSDDTYDPAEFATIKEQMKKIFPEGTDMEKKLYQTIREYNAFDRSKLPQLLRDSFEHFHPDGDATRSRLHADVQAIVMADGKVTSAERDAMDAIMKLLEFVV